MHDLGQTLGSEITFAPRIRKAIRPGIEDMASKVFHRLQSTDVGKHVLGMNIYRTDNKQLPCFLLLDKATDEAVLDRILNPGLPGSPVAHELLEVQISLEEQFKGMEAHFFEHSFNRPTNLEGVSRLIGKNPRLIATTAFPSPAPAV